MSRPLRFNAAGLWHHVMNRGLEHRSIFVDDLDRDVLLGLLGECRDRWAVRTHAVCLMSNHYHFLLEDPQGHLSRALRHLDAVYTQRFNRRHGRDGPLLRGRFRSRVVQQERYALEVVRYIHLNPVAEGLCKRAGDFPWSSHRHYLSGRRPDWLSVNEMLEPFGGDRAAGRREFDRFVHDRAPADVEEELARERWAPVLGDRGFVDEMRALGRRQYPSPSSQLAGARRFLSLTVDEVIASVIAETGMDPADLVRGTRGRRNATRLVAILLCRDRTAATAEEIGAVFGVGRTAVSALRASGARLARSDHDAGALLDSVTRRLAAGMCQ